MNNLLLYIQEKLVINKHSKVKSNKLNTLNLPEETINLFNKWCENIIDKIKDNNNISSVNKELNKYNMDMERICNILDHNYGGEICPDTKKLLDDAWSIIMRDDEYKNHNSLLYNYFIFNLPFFI